MSHQVTVFGASGKVGRLVVAELLARGDTVVAFVHREHSFPAHAGLTIVRGDIYNPEDVRVALQGSDIVISALGSWGTSKKDVLTVGMRHVIAGMQQHDSSRIISLTGADARAPGDHLSLVHRLTHLALGIVAGKVLRDGEQHIALLAASNLNWTVIRSPIMTSSRSKRYALGTKRPLPWAMISRRAVALALVNQVAGEAWSRQAPYIS
jgi:putative NADH-flavin reductase